MTTSIKNHSNIQERLEGSKGQLIVPFSTVDFPFESLFRQHISFHFPQCKDPGLIHEFIPEEFMPTDVVKGTHHTYGHDILYAIDDCFRQDHDLEVSKLGFHSLYKEFIEWLAKEIFTESIYYQFKPTFRIHFPKFTSNQAGLGKMHTDRDWNHPPEEINFWMPLFHCKGTSTLLLEDDYHSNSFSPCELGFGKLLIFDSSLYHGNQLSEESMTRISMDFRIIPKSLFKANIGQYSQTAGLEFTNGGYYQYLPI